MATHPTWLKPTVFAAALVPLLWLGGLAGGGGLGANPIEAVNRFLGDWALRFLLLGLAVTPLRRLSGWAAVGRLRRMLGLFAFFYASLHVASYVGLDHFFDWAAIGRDVLHRTFITVGMAAALLLLPLAATSTDAMLRRLGGRRWKALHRAVFVIAPLAALHYWMMVKADHRQPLLYATLVALLLGYRVLVAWRGRHPGGDTRPLRP